MPRASSNRFFHHSTVARSPSNWRNPDVCVTLRRRGMESPLLREYRVLMLACGVWYSSLVSHEMNSLAASGFGVSAKMTPVRAHVMDWSFGVRRLHHVLLPALTVVRERTRVEFVELCRRIMSFAGVAVPLTHWTSFSTSCCNQEWPYLEMMSAKRYATASSSFG